MSTSHLDPASIAQGRIPMGSILLDPSARSVQPAGDALDANIYAATVYRGGNLLPFNSGIYWIAPADADATQT